MVQSTTRLESHRQALPLTIVTLEGPILLWLQSQSPHPSLALISSHSSQNTPLQLHWPPRHSGACQAHSHCMAWGPAHSTPLSPLHPFHSVHMAPFLLPSGPLLDLSILNCNTLRTPCCCPALLFSLTLTIIYCTI